MSKRDRIIARISLAEKNFKDNKLNFQVLDFLFIDPILRNKLFNDEELLKRFTDIYSKCMKTFSAQMRNLSLSNFDRIPPKEFEFLYERNSNKTPHYNRFVNHVNSFALSVQIDILQSDTIEYSLVAFQRWLELAFQAFSQNDFNTTISIYSALNTSATIKYHKLLNPRGKRLLQNLDRIFDPHNQSQNLRDLMIGQSVPNLCVFSEIITKTEDVSTEKNLSMHQSFVMTIKLLCDLQERCREITPPEYLQGTSTDLHLALYESKESQERRIKQLALKFLEVEFTGSFSVDETKELLYKISAIRFEQYTKTPDFSESNSYFEMLFKKLGFNVPESQKQYEQAIYDLRKYAQAMPKNGIVSARRQAMLDFLHQLSLRSNIRKKIEWIQELLIKNKILLENSSPDEQQRLTLNPQAIPLLEKLISALEQRDKEEMQRLAHFKVMQDLTADRLKVSKTQKEVQEVQFIIPFSIVYDKPIEPVPPLALRKNEEEKKDSKTLNPLVLANKLLDVKPQESLNTISHGKPLPIAVDKALKRQPSDSPIEGEKSSPSNSLQSSPHGSRINHLSPKSSGSTLRSRLSSRSSSPIPGHSISSSPIEPGTPLYSPKLSEEQRSGTPSNESLVIDAAVYSDVSNGPSPQSSPHISTDELTYRPRKPSMLNQPPISATPPVNSPVDSPKLLPTLDSESPLKKSEPSTPPTFSSPSRIENSAILVPIPTKGDSQNVAQELTESRSKRTSALLALSAFSSARKDLKGFYDDPENNDIAHQHPN